MVTYSFSSFTIDIVINVIANNFPSNLLSNYHIVVFYWQQLRQGVFISWIQKLKILSAGSMFLLIHKTNILNISCISVVNSYKLTKQKYIISLSG